MARTNALAERLAAQGRTPPIVEGGAVAGEVSGAPLPTPTRPCTCQGGRRYVVCCDGADRCPCRGDFVDGGECGLCGGLGERVVAA